MTATSKYLKRFEAYQNGEMPPEEVQAFLKELDQDQEMLEAWKEYMAMMDAFSDKEAVSFRNKLERAFLRQHKNTVRSFSHNIWYRVSAAAIVIVVMGALLYFFCSNNTDFWGTANQKLLVEREQIKKIKMITIDSIHDTIIRQDPQQVYEPQPQQIASVYDKEHYQISPVFAELLHNVYRSAWFKLKLPEDSVMFTTGDSLTFSWETNIEQALYFDVLDRNGQAVYEHNDSIKSPWIYRPQLEPAIYMFRFATKDQPVWMGVMVGVN